MKTYIVGGAVRDELLGLPVADRDWVVVGATPEEIVFTSGATESDNLAVRGAARANAERGRHVQIGSAEIGAVEQAAA